MKKIILILAMMISFLISQELTVPIDYIEGLNIKESFTLRSGLKPGYSPVGTMVTKFGVNHSISDSTDPEDIWEYGGLYNFTADTGTTYYFSSSSSADSQLTLFYLLTTDTLGNWVGEEITDTLQGQTKTELVIPSGRKAVRLWRIKNVNDAPSDYNGNIYVYEDCTTTDGVPDTASAVIGMVNKGNNQTLMSIFTIPTGYVGFLAKGEVGIEYTGVPGSGTNYATIQYRSRLYGKNFTVKKEITLQTTGSSNYVDERSFWDVIPAKTDIKIYAYIVSDEMGVWSAFDIIILKEEYFKDSFLSSIGQIKIVE